MNRKELLDKSILLISEFSRYGSKPGLERVSGLLERLGNPHKGIKAIHVGGTNGKGSVCRYVYSVLQEAGYRTGLFISPFIEEFTERIEYNGKQIEPEDLYRLAVLVTGKAKEMVAEGLESPTEFELLTAMAFCYFKENEVDAAILEVGLGGRGDSTNVIEEAMVSCITSISFDHMDYLGDTIEQIAWEKSGIIKRGCPLVMALDDEAVIRIMEDAAAEAGSPVINVVSDARQIVSEEFGKTVFDADFGGRGFSRIELSMPGRHQVSNALCALHIFDILERDHGFVIDEASLRRGMKSAKQPGRIEIFSSDVPVVLDGSHNSDSVRALTEWAKRFFDKKDRLLIVTGVLKDKEYRIISEMLADIGADFIVTEPDSPRKLDAEIYGKEILKHTGNSSEIIIVKDPAEAAEAALEMRYKKNSHNEEYKALIFTGSLYMIGVVRSIVRNALSEDK